MRKIGLFENICAMPMIFATLAIPSVVHAGPWWEQKPIANTPFDPNTWHLPAPAPPADSNIGDWPVQYQITINNRTNNHIAYSINGFQKSRLAPNDWRQWTLSGMASNPPVFNVSFDNGQGRTLSYRVQPGSRNAFSFGSQGLDLYKD